MYHHLPIVFHLMVICNASSMIPSMILLCLRLVASPCQTHFLHIVPMRYSMHSGRFSLMSSLKPGSMEC